MNDEPTAQPQVAGSAEQAPEGREDHTPGAPLAFDEVLPMLRMTDLIQPVAIRVAATLRIADHIAQGSTALSQLAAVTGIEAQLLRRLMRYLVSRGVFSEETPGEYGLSDLARVLLGDHPGNLRTRLDLNGPVGRGDLSFIHLLHTLETGEPAFELMYGRPFWQDVDADPQRVADFNVLQATNSKDSGIERGYDWASVGHVMDVGGGDGTLISQILQAHPSLRGTVVELPTTAESARRELAEAGLADRCDVVEQSFFDQLPKGADVYVLSKILHDWPDKESVQILQRCAEAAGTGGRVLVVENLPVGDEHHPGFSYLDLHMLMYFGGAERTFDEYQDLAARAGMSVRLVKQHAWGASFLECTVG